mgnify:CR=1 FL=1
MGNQDNSNVFAVQSLHFAPVAKHNRRNARIYSPEEFLALPMVQEFIKNNPNQHFVNEETGQVMFAQELAELYCSVNNGKKMKKALRRAFGGEK